MIGRVAATAVTVLVAALAATAVAGGAGSPDYAAQSWNILPPGQAGGVQFTKNSTDQAARYDVLTPLQDRVTSATLGRAFKPAPLGLGKEKAVGTERPRSGLVIERDRWGVPHITGKRDVDVAFGAGWATAQDRQLIMELLRGPGRLAALDAPGVDPFGLALAGRTFVASAETDARLGRQFDLLARSGARGKRLVSVIDAYIAGINGWYRKAGLQIAPWTRADVVAVAGLVGGLFGAGGGDEARRSEFLAALQRRLGAEDGRRAWEDLRLRNDTEARTASPKERPYPDGMTSELGNVVLDAGSLRAPGAAVTQVVAASVAGHVERAPDRGEAVGHGPSAGGDGTTGRVLLPADPARARSPRRRIRRAGSGVPGDLVRRPDRPRPRLCLERDLGRL